MGRLSDQMSFSWGCINWITCYTWLIFNNYDVILGFTKELSL